MKKNGLKIIFIIIIGFSFCACKALRPLHNNSILTLPKQFSENITMRIDNDENWWACLNNAELKKLVKNALINNFDIKIYKAKIAQAQARVAKENAGLFPSLDFSFNKQRTYNSQSIGNDSWGSSLNGSYNADVWGKIRDRKKSQILYLNAAKEDLKKITLELVGDIAETWVDIIAVRNKKMILNKQIKINKAIIELQKFRFAQGKASALDISQQRQALAQTSSQVPMLAKLEKILLNKLAFFSGKNRITPLQVNTKVLPKPLPLPNIGIPSDLLSNRPDIRAARMRLSSSLWEVAAAKADFLPSFKLSAKALFSNGKLDLLFHDWIMTLGASITGVIFDGGFKKAEVKRAKALANERINLYAKIVAKAVFEVEDSLVTIERQKQFIILLRKELDLTKLTQKDAMIRYKNGQSSYLPYLIARSNVERLQRQLVGEYANMIKQRIYLQKALGWTNTKKII